VKFLHIIFINNGGFDGIYLQFVCWFVGTLNKSATFLFKRAFKVMKNGIYVIVMALLVAELFKILIYANYMNCDITGWTQKLCKITKNGIIYL